MKRKQHYVERNFTKEQTLELLNNVLVDSDGCWIWQGEKSSAGYAVVPVSKSAPLYVHRAVQLHINGHLEDGLYVDHTCHNESAITGICIGSCKHRACINPEHLAPVTARENTIAASALSYDNRTHCKNGHPLTEENVRMPSINNPHKGRYCRACATERDRAYKERRKAKVK